MGLFTEEFIDKIAGQIADRHRVLGASLGYSDLHAATAGQAVVESTAGLLHGQLRLLVRIANGELSRGEASKTEAARIEDALDYVLGILFGSPLHPKARLPDDFWETEFGTLVSRVRWWLSADELITISNAAALAFGENSQANRMKIVRAIDKGLLDWVPDPSVVNPQKNRRVLRPQVEHLGEQRRRPA